MEDLLQRDLERVASETSAPDDGEMLQLCLITEHGEDIVTVGSTLPIHAQIARALQLPAGARVNVFFGGELLEEGSCCETNGIEDGARLNVIQPMSVSNVVEQLWACNPESCINPGCWRLEFRQMNRSNFILGDRPVSYTAHASCCSLFYVFLLRATTARNGRRSTRTAPSSIGTSRTEGSRPFPHALGSSR